jgi:uncharacterized protein (TIGR02452 family)
MTNKEWRARQAELHTQEMLDKYADRIEKSIKDSKVYDKFDESIDYVKRPITKIDIEAKTTSEMISKVCNKYKDSRVCALNFASYKNAGGGYIKGAMAQEEAICIDSYLYNVLSSDFITHNFYEKNLKDLHYALYDNNLVYSPDILFFNACNCDIITCAAPNISCYNKYNRKLSDRDYFNLLVDRIEGIFKVAILNKVDYIILGAWGCGVFGNDANTVANAFNKVIQKYKGAFKSIYFAIPDIRNRVAFEKEFQ